MRQKNRCKWKGTCIVVTTHTLLTPLSVYGILFPGTGFSSTCQSTNRIISTGKDAKYNVVM